MEGHEGSRDSSRSTWKLCWNIGSNRFTRDRSLAEFQQTRTFSWNWSKTKDRDVARSISTEKAPKNSFFPESRQLATESSNIFEPIFQEIVDEHITSEASVGGDDAVICCLDDKYSWEEYVKFLQPLISRIPEKLSNKDITLSSKIYKEPINIRGLEERLMRLTEENSTLDVPLEMAYGAYLLHKLTHENHILKAGEKAHKAAVLFLQAELLREVGNQLLRDSQHELCQIVERNPKNIDLDSLFRLP